VLAEQATTGVPEAQEVQNVPVGPGPTFYTRHGDWFGWVDVALTVALLVVMTVRR
jgi:apolipoprotein N-acyltransferase